MLKKMLLMGCLLICPLLQAYGNKILIQYEKIEQLELAKNLGNDLQLALKNKVELYLEQSPVNEKKHQGFSKIFTLKEKDGKMAIIYQDLAQQNVKEFYPAKGQPERVFLYKTVEEITQQILDKKKRKIKLLYFLSTHEDFIQLKKMSLNQEHSSLKEKMAALTALFNQDSFIMQMSANTLSQFIETANGLMNQGQKKEIYLQLKFLELFVLNQVSKNLKENQFEVMEVSLIKNKDQGNEREDFDLTGTLSLSFKPKTNQIMIKVNLLEKNKNSFVLLEENMNVSGIEEQKIKEFSKKISEEMGKRYPALPVTTQVVWKQVAQIETEKQTQFQNSEKYNKIRNEKEIQEYQEKERKLKPQLMQKTYGIYGGLVWQAPKNYTLSSALEQKTNSLWGFSIMANKEIYPFLSVQAKYQYFPFSQKVPIIDEYGIHYGYTEISSLMDFIAGADLFLKYDRLKYGITIQPGVNLARIEILPSNPVIWAGKDTKGYFFSGVKFQAGLFIESDYWLPVYFEILYQVGKTEGLEHKGLAANLMVRILSF